VTNEIPVSRGLGSSAACIVGGLMAANEMVGKRLDQCQLLNLAVELEGHPDNVAPALLGGMVVSSQTPNGLAYVRFDVPEELEALIAIPDVSLSTREARDILPDQVSHGDAVYNVGKAALLVAALTQKKFEVLSEALDDRLHQPYRSQLLPSLAWVYQKAREKKLQAMVISGAGPTLAYLLWPESRRRQQEFLDLLGQTEIDWEIKTLSGDNRGATLFP